MGFTTTNDRRENRRIKFNAAVTICSNYMIFNSQTEDISLGGALIHKPGRWIGGCGDQFELLISSTGNGNGIDNENENQIQMKARVRHITDKSLGFFCEHIDVDSYTRLRELLAYKLGDISLVNQELVSLV